MNSTREMVRVGPDAAVLLTDLQLDFLPGGSLAVAGGDDVIAPARALIARGLFRVVIATQDWHPPDHVSFASQHPGRRPFASIDLYGRSQTLWPDHCVQDSPGAALHRGVPTAPLAVILRKGADRLVDSYSAFRNNWDQNGERPPTGLAGLLRERGVREVFVLGLARDFCVRWSAEDAAAAGFRTTVLWDLTRPVAPASDDDVRRALAAAGVRTACAEQLTR